MSFLLLVHHGDAVGPGVDPMRPLSSVGRAATERLAGLAAQRGVKPDVIWHSGKLRARQTAELFWISTVRADGRPHVTPLVAVWVDGAIHFCTGFAEQKAINLGASPHVILMTGCNRWDAGLDVVVEGEAVQVTDDDMLHRLAGVWATKWDGRWQWLVRDGRFHHQGSNDDDDDDDIAVRRPAY